MTAWLKRLRTLRRDLDDLYGTIDVALVTTLEWHGLMEPGALEKSDKTEAAFDRLLRAVERDPVLTTKIKRPRGAQRQPFKNNTIQGLRDPRVGLTKESAITLLRLIGVKPPEIPLVVEDDGLAGRRRATRKTRQ